MGFSRLFRVAFVGWGTLLTLASLSASPEPYPYRFLTGEPGSDPKAVQRIRTAGLNEDLILTYQRELAAEAKLSSSQPDRLKRLAHQHETFRAKNEELLRALTEYAKAAPLEVTPVVDEALAKELRSNAENNPIAGRAGVNKYDPEHRVGFCFGRASYFHLELSRRKIPQGDMLKIYAFGNLKHSGLLWDFHVVTAVLGVDSTHKHRQWWILDSLFEQPLGLEDWMARVSRFSILKTHSDVRFYSTDPRKFRPISGEYSSKDLRSPEYNGFFEDLRKYFK